MDSHKCCRTQAHQTLPAVNFWISIRFENNQIMYAKFIAPEQIGRHFNASRLGKSFQIFISKMNFRIYCRRQRQGALSIATESAEKTKFYLINFSGISRDFRPHKSIVNFLVSVGILRALHRSALGSKRIAWWTEPDCFLSLTTLDKKSHLF